MGGELGLCKGKGAKGNLMSEVGSERDRERGSWCYGMGQQIVHHYFNKQNHTFLSFPLRSSSVCTQRIEKNGGCGR